jgi:phosphoglucomutase
MVAGVVLEKAFEAPQPFEDALGVVEAVHAHAQAVVVAQAVAAADNGAAIGGLKVIAASGWFAARPSGTENIYKIYAESFKDQDHLNSIVAEAKRIVTNALAGF